MRWRSSGRRCPGFGVEKDYRFASEQGEKSLAELFLGRLQLIVYHFMFGPDGRGGMSVLLGDGRRVQWLVEHLAQSRRDALGGVAGAARQAPRLPRADGLELSAGHRHSEATSISTMASA